MSMPVPSEFFSIRIASRFVLVTFLPNFVFASLVAALLAAGAPRQRPSWGAIQTVVERASFTGILLFLTVVVIISAAVYPLNYPMVQLMEGHWPTLTAPLLDDLYRAGVQSELRRRRYYEGVSLRTSRDAHQRLEASQQAEWIPRQNTLPTALGNALFVGETRAGERYGMRTSAVWPRLVRLLPADDRAQITDLRNQMDAAVRMCALALLMVPVTIALLIPYDIWLFVPFACFVFAWLTYRAAIAAAKRFSLGMSVLFDLHHLRVWDGLTLPRPLDLIAERTSAEALSKLLGDDPVDDVDRSQFVYVQQAHR